MRKVLINVINLQGEIKTRLVPLVRGARPEDMVGENEVYYGCEAYEGKAARNYILISKEREVK